MSVSECQTDAVVIGAGIAGLAATWELLEQGRRVVLIDRDSEQRLGGMANDAFGGMHLLNTREQNRNGIRDSEELAWDDWLAAAQYGEHDRWPREWGKHYIEHSHNVIYDWLRQIGISFFPVVQWVERGDYGFGEGNRGNSVPRYHVIWGTGWELAQTVKKHVLHHRHAGRMTLLCGHRVDGFLQHDGTIKGCEGVTDDGRRFRVRAEHTVICAGGINGNLDQVCKHWDSATYGPYPENILSGSHPYADGKLHDRAQSFHAAVTHLGWMWNYAAGVVHPQPEYPNHGLSVIPARSALWMDAFGNRVGPLPLVTGFDTHRLCQRVNRLPYHYGWQIMNRRIANKEVAVSGSHINPAFKNKNWLGVIGMALKGNPQLIDDLIENCADVATGNTLEELVVAMNAMPNPAQVSLENMRRDIAAFDAQLAQGARFVTDDQIRRLQIMRQWRGDKVRICRHQPIVSAKAGPLIAIKTRLISRKSMGGFQTDLQSRVLDTAGNVIPGLYAAGEAAGFGGGGLAGIRSLEGTFLTGCILTARRAGQFIGQQK